MVINYLGGECFKVSFGDTILAFNPPSKEGAKKLGLKEVKFGADVALSTLNHSNFNGVEQVGYGERQPFVVDGPGEYEIGDVTVRGFGVSVAYDGKEYINTIYQVTLEGITMLFMGVLNSKDIDSEIIGKLGDVDIMFVPIGNGDVLDAAAASALAVKLEARAVIPMHYDEKALKTFLKEEGHDAKPQEKLTIKKKDVLAMEGEIVVLKV